MKEQEVKDYLSKRMWDRFAEWIVGQTVGTVDGEWDFYDHDVIRFADACLKDKPTYFD